MTFRLDRRALLRGAGGVFVALPLLDAMQPARAATATGAKRVVFFFTPNGTNEPSQFYPAQTGSQFVLGSEVAPLEPLRQRLLILSGINMESAKEDSGDAHSIGMSHMLTGTHWVPATGYAKPGGDSYTVGFGGGISVDQKIAEGFRAAKTTPFASLEFGVQSVSDYGVHPFSRMNYRGSNDPIPAVDSPADMYQRLFGDGSNATNAALARSIAQRRSVLDFVKDDFARLKPRMGANDRRKLDAHFTAVRNLEDRLSRIDVGKVCETGSIDTSGDALSKSRFGEVGKQQMDLLTLALKCDFTRVATLQWSWARSELTHPWAQAPDSHHGMSHGSASAELSRINNWYAKQLAYLATAMAAVDEGGTSMLDNAVIYWCGECAYGFDHNLNNIRAFLIGSCQGALKTGQHLAMGGQPHNKLLVTLMNAMGLPDDQFGDPKFGSGPLQGVLA
ncbi:MAG: DUF1552 domain-containing protein [Myxococcaceae bacterium]|nr:DUF1552 domain-containing protein [Myxococcaceae bacterium]